MVARLQGHRKGKLYNCVEFPAMSRTRRGGGCTGYLDESRRRDVYALAVALVADHSRQALRRAVGELLLPGERRFHMAKERPDRRRQAIDSMGVIVENALIVIASVRSAGSEEGARRACLGVLVPLLATKDVAQLCLERRDDARDRNDRLVIRSLLQQGSTILVYEHRSATEERLLWIPDILAWAATNPAARHRLGPGVEVTRIRS